MSQRKIAAVMVGCVVGLAGLVRAQAEWGTLERQFHEVPMEARRLVAPLFWLHGDESKERLELLIEKMVESHNGGFVAESRPHVDWLGEGWYRDLDVCLAAAKKHNLKMWIFDEKWWPSQTVGNTVPEEYRAKRLVGASIATEGGVTFVERGFGGRQFVAAVAGRMVEGGVDPKSLVDLRPFIQDGMLAWPVPAGAWRIMKFTWTMAPATGQAHMYSVDGASQDCVDWFIQKVYQPHYERYKEDFGKTIVGYFYDEPEVRGDWGTEVPKVLAERGIDYHKALVAWKFGLAAEQVAYRYAYLDAFLEAWGRVMYGTMSRWCEERGVKSIGHFMEHGKLYLNFGGVGPGNMIQVQKYSAMGAIDLVVRQLRMGQRPGRDGDIFQMPKLASSISHAYGKADDVAMCEIYGGYGQQLGYDEMKWLADQHQVRGLNFMVPHSFNPRAPFDTDYPPYFYNGGFEPKFPLYRVWADYNHRLGLLLTGGHHACPVALVFCGNSIHAGKALTPDQITTALDDVRLDSDWIGYDVLEQMAISGKELRLRQERYRVMVIPAAEVVPFEVMAKARAFFEGGGVVMGYGIRPSRSTTVGKSDAEIAALSEAIWGAAGEAGVKVCKTSATGGRSYFLPERPTPEELRQAIVVDAGVRPTMEVIEGQTDNWVHVLHRVKGGRDVFLICNQNHEGAARTLKFRAQAAGEPECWDAMRNEITNIAYQRISPQEVEFELTMEPAESVLVVFQERRVNRPVRGAAIAAAKVAEVVREASPVAPIASMPEMPESPAKRMLAGTRWAWYPEGQPHRNAPAGVRYFRKEISLPADKKVSKARGLVAADNEFVLFVNGQKVGEGSSWQAPVEMDLSKHLSGGSNVLAIAATNGQPTGAINPAGVIGVFQVELEGGATMELRLDKTWKSSREAAEGWMGRGFDDGSWAAARELVLYGEGPWGSHAKLTVSPTKADPFFGRCTVASEADLKDYRVFLEMEEVPEGSAVVKVNGEHAGGVIGRPWRIEVGSLLKAGGNTIDIQPLAPKSVKVVFYGKGGR